MAGILPYLKVFLQLPPNHNHLYPRSIILTQNTHSVIYIKFAYITKKSFFYIMLTTKIDIQTRYLEEKVLYSPPVFVCA